MAKRPSNKALVTKATVKTKTLKAAQPPKPVAKQPPSAETIRTKARASWNAQEREAAHLAKSRHGATVDERALARSTDGQRWAARKTH